MATDDEEKKVDAFYRSKSVEAVVQCNSCEYWGKMEGFIEPDSRDVIQFVCPECKTIEVVRNYFA